MVKKSIEKQKKKSNSFYKIIDDIRSKKQGDLLNDEENLKSFNNFMALRFLSMDRDIIDIVNLLNQFQGSLDKKSMYDILVDIIPENNSYIKYTTTKKEECKFTSYICDYYQCSPKEALEYISIKGDEWAEDIMKQMVGNYK